jgi:hypothetical protein
VRFAGTVVDDSAGLRVAAGRFDRDQSSCAGEQVMRATQHF